MIKIAHASIDENGKASGGAKGDQTKKEVCIRDWYDKSWHYVIRFLKPEMREKFAQAMEAIANNDNIGYDQNGRNTLLAEAEKVNWDITKITNKCECDCSSAITVACICAGVPKGLLYIGGNCATTRTLRARLKNTGLVEITNDKKFIGSDEYALRGDIYLKEGSHVIAALGNGSKTQPKEETPAAAQTKSFALGEEIELIPGATYASGKAIPTWVFSKTLYYRGKNDKGIVFSTLKEGAVTGTVKPEMIKGYTKEVKPSIKVGSVVMVNRGARNWAGRKLASFVYGRKHIVSQLEGDRAVITYNGVVVAAIHKGNLTLV
jgi:hypothetical protein